MLAAGRIEQPDEKAEERALAGAADADEHRQLAGLEAEIDAVQHRALAIFVGEPNVAQHHDAARAGEIDRLAGVANRRFDRQAGAAAARRRQGLGRSFRPDRSAFQSA